MGVFLFSIIEKLVNETEKEPSGAHHHRNWSSSPQSKQKRGCTLQNCTLQNCTSFRTHFKATPSSLGAKIQQSTLFRMTSNLNTTMCQNNHRDHDDTFSFSRINVYKKG